MKNTIKELKTYLILWSTQGLSQLGSSMTSFALTLWLYEKTGSALQTALLSICTYAPYVMMSIFAGALSDRWNKKRTILAADTLATCCTLGVLFLLKMDLLMPIHLYLLNVLSGLMNTVQQPASEVAMTLITPKKYYQKTSGLNNMSRSLVTILNPLLATAVYALAGMDAVIGIDLCTFVIAFFALLLAVRIPEERQQQGKKETLFESTKGGLRYLKETPLILTLILFLASVNLISSCFNAVLPALILPRANGGDTILGIVTSCSGIAMFIGSFVVTLLPTPKNRVKVIYLTMLFSLGSENYIIAFSNQPVMWCVGQVIGWILVPVMSANLDVILRTTIPVEMQGRVYACRNSLQFFTIPIGLLLGGALVDKVCEPIMAKTAETSMLAKLFGVGKGAGASFMMFVLAVVGTIVCLAFGQILKKYKYVEVR